MLTPELEKYIKESLEQGIPEQDIKTALISTGWQESDINEGFKSFVVVPLVQNYSDTSYENKKETISIAPKGKFSKKSVIILIVIFILLTSGAFGFYHYNKIKIQSEMSTKLSETPVNEIVKPKSPKDNFLEFKTALENAKTYEEAASLAKQYMSRTTDIKALGYEQINLSIEQKNQFLALLKITPPLIKDILDISEELNVPTGHLIIRTKDNKLCGLPLFLEDNQWKFGIMDCKETTVAQPSQSNPQNFPANAITSCGSIKYINIMNIDGARTSVETDALNCMVQALTSCMPKSLIVNGVQVTNYQIESKENQYCDISRNAGLKTTCKVPLTYISSQRQRYNSLSTDDIFLQSIISSIDAGGKITDTGTGQTITEFACQ